jgi:hypothetical protein
VNYANPGGSVFAGAGTLSVAAYSLNTCATTCVRQPGTTQGLDPIADGRLMFRLQYRNFGDHEALVSNHNVDVGAHHFAPRWYELRRTGGGAWTVFQQGTYAPDADNRWMGSAALDGSNDLAIGYSVSGAGTFPGIRYAGRLPTDPLGSLGQGEATLIAGGGSQLHSSGRWGDYSALTVDPSDDCTFWYTQQYYSATSNHNWQTRIGSFKFPSCALSSSHTVLDATAYLANSTGQVQLLPQPTRIADTRGSGGPIAAGQSRCFTVAGVGGIPQSAAGAVLNVTGVGYSQYGWLTVYPNGQAVPSTSTVNFDTREYAIANGTIARIGTGGQVCINAGRSGSNVILDATGFLVDSTGQVQLLAQPDRVIDTRTLGPIIAAGQSQCFSVANVGNVPSTAAGLVVNVTAVGYTDVGWLTLYPSGQALPSTSTLNFDPNAEYAIANGAIARIGAGGQVCVNAGRAASHVILDVAGYLATSTGQIQLLDQPVRLVDTRSSGGPILSGQSRCFTVVNGTTVPSSATGMVLNVTGVGYTSLGWLTLFPNGQAVPSTSTLNFDTTETAIANGAIARIGTSGQVCVNVGRVS